MKTNIMIKREHSYIVLAIVVLLVAIFALSVRNDFRFNEELRIKDCKALQRDSLMQSQMDSITLSLSEVITQMDSFRREQKDYKRIENLNTDTIKASLSQIKRVGNQIHNLVK